MTDTPADPPVDDTFTRPFADFLRELGGGRAHDELSDALRHVTEAVVATGKPGSVTLTLSVQPLKDANNVLKVSDNVKAKIPELARPANIYFPDRSGNLVRDNPNQPAFETMRALPTADEPRELDPRERAAGERPER